MRDPLRVSELALAAAIGRSFQWTRTLLDELERDGLAKRVPGTDRWTLTAATEARFGQILRGLEPKT